MKLTDFSVKPQTKLQQLSSYLKEQFGYSLKQGNVDSTKLRNILQQVERQQWDISCSIRNYQNDPRYIKSVMVGESIKIMLSEIAPKRSDSRNVRPKRVDESIRGLKMLMEQDLQQAEVLLAAKSMVGDLQDMAEKIAKLQTETLMALTERIKEVFGTAEAEAFNSSVEGGLQQVLDTLKQNHESLGNAVAVLSGEEQPDMAADAGAVPADDMGVEQPMGDEMAGAPAAAGPEEEAIGRELK
jgi:uncharacterized protein (UPF0335 family)